MRQGLSFNYQSNKLCVRVDNNSAPSTEPFQDLQPGCLSFLDVKHFVRLAAKQVPPVRKLDKQSSAGDQQRQAATGKLTHKRIC